MIIMYRIPGVVSCFALCFYMVIEALLFSLIRVNLSLPGIAGIILSIGMAVDANVIIFERIKEEMAAGKTVKSAIDSGFKRAFTAILDSNITTLIACGVLFFLGTGTIVGFATTLGIGVIVSMFTALTITHFLLRRMVDFHIRNPKAYGLRERKADPRSSRKLHRRSAVQAPDRHPGRIRLLPRRCMLVQQQCQGEGSRREEGDPRYGRRGIS